MKNTISSFIKEFIKVVIIVAVAVPTIALFAAWTGPTGAPPTNNADAPVNVGPLDQIKLGGWLSLGNLISRGTTILARDDGNVGIGMGEDGEIPQAKFHVGGGDAIFEGRIQIKSGLPEKNKVLTAVDETGLASWESVTADMIIPQGFEEVFFNAGEDIYNDWGYKGKEPTFFEALAKVRGRDTCNGDVGISGAPLTPTRAINGVYTCANIESKICEDISVVHREPDYHIFERTVECRTAKILRKNEWKYAQHKYTGTAIIDGIDHDGDTETCWVDVKFSNDTERYSCSNRAQSPDLDELSFSKCNDWLLGAIKTGAVCSLPFPQNKITSFNGSWDMKTDRDYGEGWRADGSGALDLNFTELK